MSAQYKCVLFDLDGTLLDTANDLGEALNFVLTKHGLKNITKESYRPVASDGAFGLLNLGFGAEIDNFDRDVLRAEFLDYYQNNIAMHTCLYEGVESLITSLDNQSIPWGIVTNKPGYLTELLLPCFNILSSSRVMVAGDTLAQRKPHPAPLYHACKQIDVDPNKTIYVGDALRDIEAGNAANMCTVIAKWGYIPSSVNCSDWQADYQFNCPEKITEII